MKKVVFISILLIFVALAMQDSFAQDAIPGCCCNATGGAQTPTWQPSGSCDLNAFPNFVGGVDLEEFDLVGEDQTIICNTVCGLVKEEPTEFIGQPEICGDSAYSPPATNLEGKPIRGERAVRLTWQNVCPTFTIGAIISRCEGDGCTNFVELARIPADQQYIDVATEMNVIEWGKDYTYSVSLMYSSSTSDSDPVTVVVSPGDIECFRRYDSSKFCLNANTYDDHVEYLRTYGYSANGVHTPAGAFEGVNFGVGVAQTFGVKFGHAYQCDDENKLSGSLLACSNPNICVVRNGLAECIATEECKAPEAHFGLNYTSTNCEGEGTAKRYCFYDKSKSLANTCYACDSRMACYDYKSEGACGRDNCGIGPCQWFPVSEEIGTGVCINPVKENCQYCETPGSGYVESVEAHNAIFDSCTPQKADALTISGFPCFYNKETRGADGCSTAKCTSYSTKDLCGRASGNLGITLTSNNVIQDKSTDACNIGVCRWDERAGYGCFKDSNAKAEIPGAGDYRDCHNHPTMERDACELDYFPPLTNVFAQATVKLDRIDFLNFYRRDKSNYSELYLPVNDLDTYNTFICSNLKGGTPCTPNIPTTAAQLLLNDGRVQDGNIGLLGVGVPLPEGDHTLRYYTQDIALNVEEIGEVDFSVCHGCHGPIITDYDVDPGYYNRAEGKLFTSSSRPEIRLTFSEPITLTLYNLQQIGDDKIYALEYTEVTPTVYTLRVPSTLEALQTGAYELHINGHDADGTYMDSEQQIPLIFDGTAPVVSIKINGQDAQGQHITDAPLESIELTYVEEVTLGNVNITHLALDSCFGKRSIDNVITDQFTTTDNKVFTATNINVIDGPNTINVVGVDLAQNAGLGQADFTVGAGAPVIFMKQPEWGVEEQTGFDLEMVTLRPASCRYWFSESGSQPPNQFTDMDSFNAGTGGTSHIHTNFNHITTYDQPFPLWVRCQDVDDITLDTIKECTLTLDNTPPRITNAEAVPNPVIQLTDGRYETFLAVQTDDFTFCKYSETQTSYGSMEFGFPETEVEPHTLHLQKIVLPGEGSYNYNVMCENGVGMLSTLATVNVEVDDGIALSVSATSPPEFTSERNFDLIAKTNKNTICDYKDNAGTSSPLGERNMNTTHREPQTNMAEGEYTWPITCGTGGQATKEEATVDHYFYVDLTKPKMNTVDDTSEADDPEYTYFQHKMRVMFDGEDLQSGVSHFRVELFNGSQLVHGENKGKDNDGEFIYINGLKDKIQDKTLYKFKVNVVDQAGLESNVLSSDGVTTSFDSLPAYCSNERFDSGKETDTDCGGNCNGCENGGKCSEDGDCNSGFCGEDGTCKAPLCSDGEQNGQETDVDCGGENCKGCGENQNCFVNSDCGDGLWCSGNSCVVAPDCNNGAFDFGEGDVDCGRACSELCGDGKRCTEDADCSSGVCLENFICGPSSCIDEQVNGDESDVDCGGSCAPCEAGKACVLATDCASGFCDNGFCSADSSCGSGELDGLETDVDCGGNCPACGEGQMCLVDGDCGEGLGCAPPRGTEQYVCMDKYVDTDGDGMPDYWELRHGLDPDDPSDADLDPDGDGLTNLEEYQYFAETGRELDPNNADTDGDGYDDGKELELGTDPTNPDEPGVGQDSDKDGIPDWWEIQHGLDPFDPTDAQGDPDGDGLTNLQEFLNKTDPHNADTDGDGWSDGMEVERGYDPLDPNSHPISLWWLWLLLVLLLGATGAAYYYIQKQKEKGEDVIPPHIRKKLMKLKPLQKILRKPEDRVKALRNIAMPEEEFPSLTTLKKRELQAKQKKEKANKELFASLGKMRSSQRLGKGKRKAGSVDALRSFAKGKSTKEVSDVFGKLQKLGGDKKLSPEELAKLLKELNITAKYWREHKDELMSQAGGWMKQKSFSRKPVSKVSKAPAKGKAKKVSKSKGKSTSTRPVQRKGKGTTKKPVKKTASRSKAKPKKTRARKSKK